LLVKQLRTCLLSHIYQAPVEYIVPGCNSLSVLWINTWYILRTSYSFKSYLYMKSCARLPLTMANQLQSSQTCRIVVQELPQNIFSIFHGRFATSPIHLLIGLGAIWSPNPRVRSGIVMLAGVATARLRDGGGGDSLSLVAFVGSPSSGSSFMFSSSLTSWVQKHRQGYSYSYSFLKF
jgi:hypothetical protein